ncbi:hypothetical protein GN244_ATG06275 [Phytophthora infestans]|uniref:FAR1 domain-containing protein n=1 Tax=Phytophthora infestans TaxID=4787 RepID=A0A833WLV9_PHYIN|nr:hypothetical protein GN244_ATG06275 [Phytophthora infestans]
MSRAEVRAFVTKKREQYAARYTAGEVEAPPLPVTRACKRSKTQATPRTKQPDQLDGIGEESPESPDDCRDPDYVLDAGDDIASADEDISADDEAACVSPPAEVLTCSTDKEARHYFGISESSDDEGQQPPTQSNLQLDQTERLQIEHPENRQGGQQETLHLDHPEKLQGALPMSVQNGLPEKVNNSVKPFQNAGMPSRFLSLPSDSCVEFLKQFPSRWLSWERFHSELHAFSAQTNQRFIVRSTSSVKKRNDQMGDPSRHFPLSWKQYCKTLRCTHGVSHQARGKGVRQHQSVRYTGCTAKINATLSRLGSDFYVFVRPTGEHNHPLSNELWDYYAENRTIQDPMLLSTMGEMRSAGSSSKGILAWLRKKTGNRPQV